MNIKSKKSLFMFSKVLFVLYLIILVWVVIFKCNIATSLTGGYLYFKTVTFKERFLLYIVPFKNYFTCLKINEIIDAILNAIIFIPLGLYISYFVKNKKFLKVLFIVFGVSLFFELFQLFTLMGAFQTEDLIVNTLGGVIGYLTFKLIYKDITKRIYTLNIITLVFIVLLIPIVIYAIFNTINNFDLYISIINKTY